MQEALTRPQYSDVTVRSVRIVKDPSDVTHPPERAVVTLGIPPGKHYPGLSNVVAESITERADRDISVEVKYVQVAHPVDG